MTKEERIHVSKRAWEMRLEHYSITEIALELGVSYVTVLKHLKRIEDKLAAELMTSATRIRAKQVAQLERIASEAMRAWERSQQDEVTRKAGKNAQGAYRDKTTKGRDGSAVFLATAMKAKEDIRKLLGLDAKPDDAPVQQAVPSDVAAAAIAAGLAMLHMKPPDQPPSIPATREAS